MTMIRRIATRIVSTKAPSTIKKGIALATPLVITAKEAAAHPSPFYHMHDHQGHTIGMAAGVLLFVGSVFATGVALYKAYNKKTQDVKEKTNKE